jgi:hypothetical protein
MTATLDAALLSRHALVPLLGTNPPPATASRAEAIRHYGHDTPIQQQRVAVWACWAALERVHLAGVREGRRGMTMGDIE